MPTDIEIVPAPRNLTLIDFGGEDCFLIENRSCEDLA
jgi:hypothetical protein